MPKRSKDDDFIDDSDEEVKAPKKKQSAAAASTGEVGAAQKNIDGETFIEIGGNKRVTVRSFKGKPLVDIREFYNSNDKMLPGKKGISLNPEQWKLLQSSMAEVQKALDAL